MATAQIMRKKDLAHQKRVEEKLEAIETLLLALSEESRMKPKGGTSEKTSRSAKK